MLWSLIPRRTWRVAGALAAAALSLGACAPTAPKGVEKQALDDAVERAIGDPSTCVLIAQAGKGKTVYRYNKGIICDRSWPSCEGAGGLRSVDDLLDATLKDGKPRTLSCFTNPDGSRGVGWASGTIPGKGLVYAAVMEGERALPGRMMAERLALAFRKVGL